MHAVYHAHQYINQRTHPSPTKSHNPPSPHQPQSNRLRARYLAAVLRQDVAFFDTQATTGGLLQGLNEDSLVGGWVWWVRG